MVAVYSPRGHLARMVLRAMESVNHEAHETKAGFRQALAGSLCAVVVFPSLSGTSELTWLRDLVDRHSTKGWILITEFSPRNVQRILDLSLPLDVVWLSEAEARLPAVINRILSSDPLSRLATRLEGSNALDAHLRQALADICRTARPPRTIGGMARLAGMTKGQVRYRWQLGFGRAFTPREFLDRVFLVRIYQCRLATDSWDAVAREMKVDRNTLRRLRRKAALGPETLGTIQTLQQAVRALGADMQPFLASRRTILPPPFT